MDKYDKAIKEIEERFKEYRDKKIDPKDAILEAWANESNPGGILFPVASPSRLRYHVDNGHKMKECGDVVQIKMRELPAYTRDLTLRIRKDNRIPLSPEKITLERLWVFAEWARIIDKEIPYREPK